jgi:hypothetical protein
MMPREITDQLQAIASASDFEWQSGVLTAAWISAGADLETVEPILQFMEEHPKIDYGVPGPLVHFMEGIHGRGEDGRGYDEMVIESVRRLPTAHTVWLLNRIVNATKVPDERTRLIEVMSQAKLNPKTDEETLANIDLFLDT